MKDLTQGNETKLIIFFSLPMLVGNVFQQFYNMVDSWVVGRFVGTQALAAVGSSFPILFFMVSLVMGVSMGANILIAQYYGAKDMAKVRSAIDTTYLTLFWSGLLLTMVGVFAAEPILLLMRVPQDVLPLAAQYLRIIFGGILLLFGYNGVGAILRGLGDSMTPLYMLMFSTLLNVVLDLLFVRAFGWGVAGVAWATVIAQGVAFLGSAIYLNITHEVLRTNFLKLKFDRDIFKLSIKIGLPSGIQQSLVSMGFMFVSAVVNGFGSTVMAGYAAASRIDSFIGMPSMNLSMALSTFVGQNLGAGKPDRARKGFRASLAIGMGITAVLAGVLLLFGTSLVGIFSQDPEVIRIGAQYLSIIAPFYMLFTVMFVANGLIRGAGEAIVPMVSTILAMWLVRVPLAVLFSNLFGVVGIWWSIPSGWVVGCSIALLYYRSGRWTKKALVRSPRPASNGA